MSQAIEAKKEIIFVLETAPEHGGVPFKTHVEVAATLKDKTNFIVK